MALAALLLLQRALLCHWLHSEEYDMPVGANTTRRGGVQIWSCEWLFRHIRGGLAEKSLFCICVRV